MDAKEAITELEKMEAYENYVLNCIADDDVSETAEVQRNIKSLQLAISALEKVETLEAENARLREKETPKEAISTGYWQVHRGGRLLVECPSCGGKIGYLEKFCSECGQAIKIDKE